MLKPTQTRTGKKLLITGAICAALIFSMKAAAEDFSVIPPDRSSDSEEYREIMEEDYTRIIENAFELFEEYSADIWMFELIDLNMDNSAYPALIVSEVSGDDWLEVPKFVYEFSVDAYAVGAVRCEITDETGFFGMNGVLPYYDKMRGTTRYFLNMTNFDYLTEGDPLNYARHKGIAELVKENGQYYLREVMRASEMWGVTVFESDEYDDIMFGDEGTLTAQEVSVIDAYLSGFEAKDRYATRYYDSNYDPDEIAEGLFAEYYADTSTYNDYISDDVDTDWEDTLQGDYEENEWEYFDDEWNEADSSDIRDYNPELAPPSDEYDEIISWGDLYFLCTGTITQKNGEQGSCYGVWDGTLREWTFPFAEQNYISGLSGENITYLADGVFLFRSTRYSDAVIDGKNGAEYEILCEGDQYLLVEHILIDFSGMDWEEGVYDTAQKVWAFPIQKIENFYSTQGVYYNGEGMFQYKPDAGVYRFINAKNGQIVSYEELLDPWTGDFVGGYAIGHLLYGETVLLTDDGRIIRLNLDNYLGDEYGVGTTPVLQTERYIVWAITYPFSDDYQGYLCYRIADGKFAQIDAVYARQHSGYTSFDITDEKIMIYDLEGEDGNWYRVGFDWNGSVTDALTTG